MIFIRPSCTVYFLLQNMRSLYLKEKHSSNEKKSNILLQLTMHSFSEIPYTLLWSSELLTLPNPSSHHPTLTPILCSFFGCRSVSLKIIKDRISKNKQKNSSAKDDSVNLNNLNNYNINTSFVLFQEVNVAFTSYNVN